jgi:hypothetical protein
LSSRIYLQALRIYLGKAVPVERGGTCSSRRDTAETVPVRHASQPNIKTSIPSQLTTRHISTNKDLVRKATIDIESREVGAYFKYCEVAKTHRVIQTAL